ncbi:hypothetical protein T05_5104 [Trichinella murrelli]|uniref:Uncharacterized protein n=1 Tax=Trichinella murrelli TaxID=144512 RepID=A0A0V0T5E1_9BILA|nr:hypothetical protein T05_5104 [Trichinella murrelli]
MVVNDGSTLINLATHEADRGRHEADRQQRSDEAQRKYHPSLRRQRCHTLLKRADLQPFHHYTTACLPAS